ncbi:MAG: pantoate--beta-alanine ligase [bacterium]|jgi:pantoate--beta-alanine ligase
MEIITTAGEMRQWVREQKRAGRSIGFVPTMGYLHEGHLSLVRRARAENDRVAVSIFVNPTQFGAGEDYSVYPRDLRRDAALAGPAGADMIFAPAAAEIYPADFSTYVTVDNLTGPLCGQSRPTHFRGVTTIVAILFNLVRPDRAYFGQKDAQQAIVIRRMARDLAFDLAVVVCPIVREPDGLALSSRNVFLQPEERQAALILSRALAGARALVAAGEKDAGAVLAFVRDEISREPLVRPDYVEIVGADDLAPVRTVEGGELLAVAAFVGKTRLIDNVVFGAETV